MKIDEEFKGLIPDPTKEEFEQLKENIKTEGCREALIIWNNILIDGHNRYKICKELNIDFKTITKDFKNREEAKMWIIKNQFGRRNLSVYDRSVLALKLEDLFKEKAKENQIVAGEKFGKGCQISDKAIENKIEPVDTKKEIAKIAGTSHDTIAKVKKIEEKAPEEVKEKVKNGEMSINQAYGYAKTYEYLENEIEDKIPERTEQEIFIEKEFKKIEEESAIQKNIHNAIYKILTTEITEEYLEVWFENLDNSERDRLEIDLNRAIEEYQKIKEFYRNHSKIRRIK